jgi:uncharacterized protein with LGFP repeats
VAGHATLALAATATAIALLVPTAAATPESDATDAITAAWEAAGGDDSELGASQGDVYPAGEGFAEDFDSGKMFYTPDTGARAMYGPVLEKYESLGGAANSDLGFPDVDEGPGRAGPDSRSVTFSGSDNPVIYYTPDHGAFVVRGAINAAWDKLGSSSSTLGVPVSDETLDGDVVTQKFAGGQLSWNRVTRKFTTVPPELADELTDLQVPVDATAAINRAWRATGGADGPLGERQGEQYVVGDDGAGQDFSRGKIFFTPATGANAIDGDVLAKYESLGGPTGSDLGFPAANEADGPIRGSRVSTFSGEDKPVIFYTPDHGAFVVRGAMKAAWDELGGADGELGAPVGDQAVDGDKVSQKFSGGEITWDRAANRFTTDPGKLASSLAGLQVPGQKSPSVAGSSHHGGFTWHWWWLAVAIAVLAVLPALVLAALWLRRRRGGAGRDRGAPDTEEMTEPEPAPMTAYGADDDEEQWPAEIGDEPTGRVRLSNISDGYGEPSDEAPPGADMSGRSPSDDDSWMPSGGTAAGMAAGGLAGAAVGRASSYGGDDDLAGGGGGGDDDEVEDTDDLDTDPTGIPAAGEGYGGRHHAASAAEDDAEAPSQQHQSAMHLPLDDPYEPPDGYPVKANTNSGLYYTPDSARYDDTYAEIWFASEEVAQFNGFVSAD